MISPNVNVRRYEIKQPLKNIFLLCWLLITFYILCLPASRQVAGVVNLSNYPWRNACTHNTQRHVIFFWKTNKGKKIIASYCF